MENEELIKIGEQEASWLNYYGYSEHRKNELFEDCNFYDRIKSIGYTKRVIPLWNRCSGGNVTSKRNVLESTIEELKLVNEPRNHDKNIFTILEYLISTNHYSKNNLISKIK